MKTKSVLVMGLLGLSFSTISLAGVGAIKEFTLPFDRQLETDGSVTVNTDISGSAVRSVDKKF